eukprot:gnl/Chilomastix_caulleri/2729.p1 GENE.gnl/Chilomastix_caulleri/2729~~gnl/Chilomastix_caulleri/2729.p1  ORF type:complete len:120 (+),score=48.88 gnl/Chilomastix_caulleri/2729:148-507(+)
MGAIQPDLSNPSGIEQTDPPRPEAVYSLIDSLPSMEERELVRSALCGPTSNAVNAINKSLNALILGSGNNEKIDDIESPDVCDGEENDSEEEIINVAEESDNSVNNKGKRNTKPTKDNK